MCACVHVCVCVICVCMCDGLVCAYVCRSASQRMDVRLHKLGIKVSPFRGQRKSL